jgi:hypothetical protein
VYIGFVLLISVAVLPTGLYLLLNELAHQTREGEGPNLKLLTVRMVLSRSECVLSNADF